MTEQELAALREEVNPVFNTAQSCLRINADIGDEDSKRLMGELDFGLTPPKSSSANLPPEMLEFFRFKLMPGFTTTVEARFRSTNRLLLAKSKGQVVDLPCGYTARGVKLAESGLRYFGFDLPAVADAMAPAVRSVIGEKENIRYRSVDATNYDSLAQGLEGAEGELLITTEGLLMYLTQPELEEVFRNIHRLLTRYGGMWVTMDNTLTESQDKVLEAITGGDSLDATRLANMAAGNMPKTTLAENRFFRKEEAEQFVAEMGFELKKIPVYDYLPETLRATAALPKEVQQRVREVFREVYFWAMTAKPDQTETFAQKSANFGVDIQRTGGALHIALTGRLDTITAPDLLATYREAAEQGAPSAITVDMSELEYISSAGLRVLLIMRKELVKSGVFRMEHMSDTVKDILEVTGFDSILC